MQTISRGNTPAFIFNYLIMKKLSLLVIATLLLGLLSTGCIDSLVPTSVGTSDESTVKTMEFKASFELNEDGTKSPSDGLRAVWNDGDAIKVFNAEHPLGELFILKTGEGGKKSGTFEGRDIGPGPYHAIFPADMEYTYVPENDQFIDGIPRVQFYSPASSKKSANVSWAQSKTPDDLVFHNASQASSFCLKGSDKIVAVNLYSTANLILDCSKDGGVELNEDDGVTFNLSVPDGVLADDYFVEFIDNQGMAMTMSAKGGRANTIIPSQIIDLTPVPYDRMYNAAFLRESDDFAAYSDILSKVAVKCCTYTEGVSQYAFYNTMPAGKRYVRFQDWNDGYSLALTINGKNYKSKTPLKYVTGDILSVKVEALGKTGTIASKENASMKVIKTTESHAWLYDSDTNDGYVIKLED